MSKRRTKKQWKAKSPFPWLWMGKVHPSNLAVHRCMVAEAKMIFEMLPKIYARPR